MSGDVPRRRAAVIRRDGPNCYWCGAPPPKNWHHTLDHVIPRSAGGSNKISNLVMACEPCNQARGGIHGPGSFQPGTPARPKNPAKSPPLPGPKGPPPGHPVMVSKVKVPKPGPVTAPGVQEEVADVFVENIEMQQALERLRAKYGEAFKYDVRGNR